MDFYDKPQFVDPAVEKLSQSFKDKLGQAITGTSSTLAAE
jgi:hypothetical protein